VDALRRHPQVVGEQKVGWALRSVCRARARRAADAGAIEAVVVASRAHLQVCDGGEAAHLPEAGGLEAVQETGCAALCNECDGGDEE
jgi:hypothetical protein